MGTRAVSSSKHTKSRLAVRVAHPSPSINQTAFSGLPCKSFFFCFSLFSVIHSHRNMNAAARVLQSRVTFLRLSKSYPKLPLASKWTLPARLFFFFSVISWLSLKDKHHMKLFTFLSRTFLRQLSLFSLFEWSINLFPSFPHEISNVEILSIFSEALMSANDKSSSQVAGILTMAESSKMAFLCSRELLRVGELLDICFLAGPLIYVLEDYVPCLWKQPWWIETLFFQKHYLFMGNNITMSVSSAEVNSCPKKNYTNK